MPDVEVASLGRRVVAIAIDWGASLLITRVLFPAVEYGSPESAVLTMVVFAVEVIVLTWLLGASFGQRLTGLRVERMDGSRLSLWRVALRALLICLVVPAAVYDSDGRGLHDRAVDSVVLRQSRTAN